MSETTQQIIERVGLIPVLRAKSVAQGRAVVDAMIAGGVTVVEVTMTVPGAIDLLKELKKAYGSKLSARLRHRHHRRSGPGHHRCRRGVRRQPQPSSRGHRRDQSQQKDLMSRRAHAHRGHHRVERRRRLCQDLSLLRRRRRKLFEIAARAVSASQAHSHRRSHAANRRRASSRPARAHSASAATSSISPPSTPDTLKPSPKPPARI